MNIAYVWLSFLMGGLAATVLAYFAFAPKRMSAKDAEFHQQVGAAQALLDYAEELINKMAYCDVYASHDPLAAKDAEFHQQVGAAQALLDYAEELINEMVCCDVYASHDPLAAKESGHEICYWGEAAAEGAIEKAQKIIADLGKRRSI